jgi:uncharacterized protein YbjT (DUF2867 family)
VRTAFVVSGYAPPGERARLHKNAFDAAVRAGVGHVVYLSFQGASADSKFPRSRDHFETEQYLNASGLAATVLRDSFYFDILPMTFDADGVLRGPGGEGRVAWVAREDVAQVVAHTLVNLGPAGRVLDVTGPESLTLAESVARLSDVTGRSLRYEDESLQAGRERRERLGGPAWEVETSLGSFAAIAAGALAGLSDTVARLTGRAPLGLEAYFATHAPQFAPS